MTDEFNFEGGRGLQVSRDMVNFFLSCLHHDRQTLGNQLESGFLNFCRL